MKAVQIFRKPYDFHFSIEKLFKNISPLIGAGVELSLFTSSYYSVGLIPRLRALKEVKKIRSDIYHVTGDVHFLVLALPRKKTILTIHDLGFIRHQNFLARFFLWLFWIYLPVKRSQVVTTVSEASKNEILKYTKCKEDKIKVVPNYVSQKIKFVPKRFESSYPIILQVGTMFNKNIERVIQALKGINCHFRIIGKLADAQKSLLLNYNIDYSNVWQLSEEELIEEYKKSDLVSFCSTLEGFGIVILEAQAVGRPVITSNVSSMPEVAGEGACLVNPFDVSSIRNGILKVIENHNYRESLIQKGRHNCSRFSMEKVAKDYFKIYEEVYKVKV